MCVHTSIWKHTCTLPATHVYTKEKMTELVNFCYVYLHQLVFGELKRVKNRKIRFLAPVLLGQFWLSCDHGKSVDLLLCFAMFTRRIEGLLEGPEPQPANRCWAGLSLDITSIEGCVTNTWSYPGEFRLCFTASTQGWYESGGLHGRFMTCLRQSGKAYGRSKSEHLEGENSS